MSPRRLTRWQWVEVIAVAGPAFLIVPMAGFALLGALLGVAGWVAEIESEKRRLATTDLWLLELDW